MHTRYNVLKESFKIHFSTILSFRHDERKK